MPNSTDSIACSSSIAPIRMTSPAPASAAFVRWTHSNEMVASTAAKMAIVTMSTRWVRPLAQGGRRSRRPPS